MQINIYSVASAVPNEREPTGDISTFYFPLRTNLHFFDSVTHYLSLKGRVKQAALLYDDTLFQASSLDLLIWQTGSAELFFPYGAYSKEERQKRIEKFIAQGTDATFEVGFDNGRTLGHKGTLERQFHGEFESVYEEMSREGCDWMGISSVNLDDEAKELTQQIRRESFSDIKPYNQNSNNIFLQKQILDYICHDLLILEATELPASIDPYFSQLLQQPSFQGLSGAKIPVGFLTLDETIPNFSSVPWEVIIEVRKMPVFRTFRAKIIEMESIVRSAVPDAEPREIQYEVRKIFDEEKDLFNELRNGHPALASGVSELTIDLIGGILQLPITPILTAIKKIDQYQKARQSWLTVHHRLVDRW